MTDTVPEATAETPAVLPPREGKRLGPVARDPRAPVGAARRARLPQPRRQTLLHPVRIDDAGAAHRRPAGGHQISLWLVVGVSPVSTSCHRCMGGCSAGCRERGDVVIVTPPGTRTDYIKRVIGLPGDTLRMVDGNLNINGQAGEAPGRDTHNGSDRRQLAVRVAGRSEALRLPCARCRRKMYCRVPTVRETFPNGHSYETVELALRRGQFRPGDHSRRHVWLMGDNRDDSADSRVPEYEGGLAAPCRGRISAAAPSSSPSP